MSDLFIIYLLIGASHWAAHTLQCSTCKETVRENVHFLTEGFVKTVGWPVHITMYLLDYFHPRRTGLTEDEVEAHVRERLKGMMGQSDGGMVVEIKQEPGETDEAFNGRIRTTMAAVADEAAARGRARERKGETENGQ